MSLLIFMWILKKAFEIVAKRLYERMIKLDIINSLTNCGKKPLWASVTSPKDIIMSLEANLGQSKDDLSHPLYLAYA